MFTFEYTAKGLIQVEKVWRMLSDVACWPQWEPFVVSVDYEGALREGTDGTKHLKNGQPLPFHVEKVTDHSGYVLTSDRGPMHIVTEYYLTEHGIGEKFVITGGTEIQREHLGKKMTASIPDNMEHLAKMAGARQRMKMPSRGEALKKFFAAWTPNTRMEYVSLGRALGRTLAEPQYSAYTLPMAHIAGCDGIGVHSVDFQDGPPDTSAWQLGKDYVMVDTGDDFPDEFDAVLAIEQVQLQDGHIRLLGEPKIKVGTSVRQRGSTIREGNLLMEAGLPIRPTDLGALALGGANTVPVWKKPVVAFLPTGSELVASGVIPQRGQTIESNGLMVSRMLREMGAEAAAYPPLKDDLPMIRKALSEVLEQADMVILNGGSSKGGEDFCTKVLREQGEIIQYQIAAVPGRPMALALIGGKPVINLPGPPLAAYFGTDWCVRAVVRRFLHQPMPCRTRITGILSAPLSGGGPVEILHRMQVTKRQDGTFVVQPLNMQTNSSAEILASNAQYVMPMHDKARNAGDEIQVELLREESFLPVELR